MEYPGASYLPGVPNMLLPCLGRVFGDVSGEQHTISVVIY